MQTVRTRRWAFAVACLCGFCGLSPLSVQAEDAPAGRVAFRVEVAREVPPDRMSVRLRAVAEAAAPAGVQTAVNAAMQSAQRILLSYKEVTASTGRYHVHPVYRKERIIAWRGSQDLVLEGGDFARLTEAMGKLQSAGLAVQEIRYLISPPLLRRIEGDLVDEAVSAFQARARRLAEGFGAQGYRLIDADVSTGGPPAPIRPMLRAQGVESAEMPPVLAPGPRRLSASVRGTIRLDF